MVGVQGGKELHFSTYKRRCADRDACGYLSASCESAHRADGVVNHLIFSSQPLSGENVWRAMRPGELVAVDGQMRLVQSQLVAADVQLRLVQGGASRLLPVL